VLRIAEPDALSAEIEARFLNLQAQATEAVQLLPQAPAELLAAVQALKSPAALSDLMATYMDISPDEKQEILETVDITARMEKVARMLAHRIEVLRCRRRSAGRPRRRSTSVSAKFCCASRWRRSSVSSAKATRARRAKSPS
jgi:ATP-dependent Lon protease